jgi:hypothetical protein
LLYAQLQEWNPPNNGRNDNTANYRQIPSDIAGAMRRHEIAMSHIASIRELVGTMEKIKNIPGDDFRAELPNWTAVVMSYDNGWQTARVFAPEPLRILRLLIPLIRDLVPAYTPDQVGQLRGALDAVLRALYDDRTIDNALAVYLVNLVNHIRQVLDDYDLRGDFELARATTLLQTTIQVARKASTNKGMKARWKALYAVSVAPEIVPTVVNLSIAAGQMLALPPGSGGN